MNIERWLDEQPPSYPEALLALIDALRNYIRDCDEVGRDLLREQSITRREFDEAQQDILQFRAMLTELEAIQIDPSLIGIIERKLKL